MTMSITLPDSVQSFVSSEDVAMHLAIGLYVSNESTLGQAAQIAGLTQHDFLQELGRRRIPVHFSEEDLDADLMAVESLVG